MSKKRTAGDVSSISPTKRRKPAIVNELPNPAAIEASLQLPCSNVEERDLVSVVLHTNRAPLVLAFAVTLLKYTMPSQPLSSRLSLAQAVVSVNSKSKAISLGIEKGNTAEDDGWGQGQPKVRIMGREIKVMKRWGYNPSEAKAEEADVKAENRVDDSQSTVVGDLETVDHTIDDETALWGLDLEALRSSNGPVLSKQDTTTKLPIYTPESARAYLLKSFATLPISVMAQTPSPRKKPSAAALAVEKERNLGLLLQSLDLLYASWAHVLSTTELDRRAWSWYVAVRPEIQDGVAGWGAKGDVRLEKILEMRRRG